jgi:hypothetical protein
MLILEDNLTPWMRRRSSSSSARIVSTSGRTSATPMCSIEKNPPDFALLDMPEALVSAMPLQDTES